MSTAVATPVDANPPSRADINRANAQHSTGPKTAAGKAICSRNAATHGLTASRVVLRNDEERIAFAEFEAALEQEILPSAPSASTIERFHFDRLVIAAWNIDRCDRVHAELLLNSGTDPLLDPDLSRTVHNIELYRRRNERSYLTAARQIRDLQQERSFRELSARAIGENAVTPEAQQLGVLGSLQTLRNSVAAVRAANQAAIVERATVNARAGIASFHQDFQLRQQAEVERQLRDHCLNEELEQTDPARHKRARQLMERILNELRSKTGVYESLIDDDSDFESGETAE